MYRTLLLVVALLLSSCKPYARQASELRSATDKNLTLKLVPNQHNSSLATLVVCLDMNLSRGENEDDYATHSLYSRSEQETCFYALHDTKVANTPYYFTNPHETQAVADTEAVVANPSKHGRNLLVSGVVIIGAATAIYMSTRSNSLLKKIKEIEEIKQKLVSYSRVQGAGNNDVHESIATKFRNDLDDILKELPDEGLRDSLQQSIREQDSARAIDDAAKKVAALTKDADKARQLMLASMLGVGAVSVFAFINELRSLKRRPKPQPRPSSRRDSALEELFKDRDTVTLSSEELWHTLRLLNRHLPARINPDLISLEGLFDVSIGSTM